MRASPALCARLRFTTKQVGRGFYRGSRTGSMGAHTEYGQYLIDWRKVRHYNVPELTDFRLTPFVSQEVSPKDSYYYDDALQTSKPPGRTDVMAFLKMWKRENPAEYDSVREHNHAQMRQAQREADFNAEIADVPVKMPIEKMTTESEQKQKS